MTKKHEELVEELNGRLGDTHLGPAGRRALTEDFITLILSAVRDGGLDEQLGVVGQGDVCALAKGDETSYYLRFDESFERGIEIGDRFIALRPPTGKEE